MRTGVTSQARAQRTADYRATRLRRAIAAAPDLTPTEHRDLTNLYNPRHTIYGDTPTTQWANLTALAVASRIQTRGRLP